VVRKDKKSKDTKKKGHTADMFPASAATRVGHTGLRGVESRDKRNYLSARKLWNEWGKRKPRKKGLL